MIHLLPVVPLTPVVLKQKLRNVEEVHLQQVLPLTPKTLKHELEKTDKEMVPLRAVVPFLPAMLPSPDQLGVLLPLMLEGLRTAPPCQQAEQKPRDGEMGGGGQGLHPGSGRRLRL